MIKYIPKDWGYEEIIIDTELYCSKILHLNKNNCCSYHFHRIKDETLFILEGDILVNLDDRTFRMIERSSIRVKPYTKHRFYGIEDTKILEVSTKCIDEDSYRLIKSNKCSERINNG